MNKNISLLGGFLVLIGVLIGLFDNTIAWWQITVNEDVTYYLSAFGYITNSENADVSAVDTNSILTAGLLTFAGAIIIIMAALDERKDLAFVGVIVAILGVGYFAYAIPNVPEFSDWFESITSGSALWGEGKVNFLFWHVADAKWQLGIGYFIPVIGIVVSLIGITKRR